MTRYLLLIPFFIVIILSSVATVNLKHEARSRFVELRELQREQDRMEVVWGQLQLEQSTWATHDRIRTVASEELDLYMPSGDAVVLVHTK